MDENFLFSNCPECSHPRAIACRYAGDVIYCSNCKESFAGFGRDDGEDRDEARALMSGVMSRRMTISLIEELIGDKNDLIYRVSGLTAMINTYEDKIKQKLKDEIEEELENLNCEFTSILNKAKAAHKKEIIDLRRAMIDLRREKLEAEMENTNKDLVIRNGQNQVAELKRLVAAILLMSGGVIRASSDVDELFKSVAFDIKYLPMSNGRVVALDLPANQKNPQAAEKIREIADKSRD